MFIQTIVLWLQMVWHQFESSEREAGQGLVEYALILVFVGIVVMALLVVLGPAISNMFDTIYQSVVDAQ